MFSDNDVYLRLFIKIQISRFVTSYSKCKTLNEKQILLFGIIVTNTVLLLAQSSEIIHVKIKDSDKKILISMNIVKTQQLIIALLFQLKAFYALLINIFNVKYFTRTWKDQNLDVDVLVD